MKKARRITCILMLIVSVFAQGIVISAAESSIVSIPSIKKQIVEDEDLFSIASVTATLGSCSLNIGINGNGVGVTFVTRATDSASKIGVKNVVLYEKALIGWREIPISEDYSTNAAYHTGGVTYTPSTTGKTYKASCTHYAIIGGREYTLENETSEIVYN